MNHFARPSASIKIGHSQNNKGYQAKREEPINPFKQGAIFENRFKSLKSIVVQKKYDGNKNGKPENHKKGIHENKLLIAQNMFFLCFVRRGTVILKFAMQNLVNITVSTNRILILAENNLTYVGESKETLPS